MEPNHLATYRKSQNLKHLAELFKPYELRVFRMCMHYLKHTQDSEDAVVDIFLELKDKVLKYDIQNFPAWLHTLVRNHCLKKLNAKARILLLEENIPTQLMESTDTTDQIDRLLEALPEAIDELDERQRWCIVLFYLHGRSYKEIEKLRHCSSMEVKSAIQNGKIKLKKILKYHVD
ncbi:MAG: hypothetical protein DRI69_02325 [Bacteroidetes bacterium]|nr:MAG: hypothetical protein DRI69_02325 [Bacteroidota bacterium]